MYSRAEVGSSMISESITFPSPVFLYLFLYFIWFCTFLVQLLLSLPDYNPV